MVTFEVRLPALATSIIATLMTLMCYSKLNLLRTLTKHKRRKSTLCFLHFNRKRNPLHTKQLSGVKYHPKTPKHHVVSQNHSF